MVTGLGTFYLLNTERVNKLTIADQDEITAINFCQNDGLYFIIYYDNDNKFNESCSE